MKINKITIIILLIILAYFPTILWLYERFTSADSYYSHGFLIPFVSFYLIWIEREEIRKIPIKTSIWGLMILIAGIFIHLLSMLIGVYFTSGFSILIALFGISLYLFGEEITKKVSFPLGFLIFMFPLPLVAINKISYPMKMFATKSAVFILKMFMPLYHRGFVIEFPNSSLVVGNPCSGLRSLITFMALGALVTYFLRGSKLRKTILFLSTIPIALLTNILRVIILSIACYHYGQGVLESILHEASGVFVFILGFVGLILVRSLLDWKSSGKDIL